MKIVFFGTPDYVLPVLDALYRTFKSSHESPIVAVVTQPPKPTGRKHFLEYSPVDVWAHKKKIPIFFDANEIAKNNVEADLGILASYGAIIPNTVISHFPYGIVNIHPSLLPKWRGSSPVQATLISGENIAGVTIIKIDKLLDHGPIITQFTESVAPDDTTESLRSRLFERSSEVLTTLLPAYLGGKIKLREQDHKNATLTHEIKKDNALIPPNYISAAMTGIILVKEKWEIPFIKDFEIESTPEAIERFIRAMQPWPIAWTLLRASFAEVATKVEQGFGGQAKRLKILEAHLETLRTTNHQLRSTKRVLDEVQLEGKNSVSWEQFKQGYPNAKFS